MEVPAGYRADYSAMHCHKQVSCCEVERYGKAGVRQPLQDGAAPEAVARHVQLIQGAVQRQLAGKGPCASTAAQLAGQAAAAMPAGCAECKPAALGAMTANGADTTHAGNAAPVTAFALGTNGRCCWVGVSWVQLVEQCATLLCWVLRHCTLAVLGERFSWDNANDTSTSVPDNSGEQGPHLRTGYG